MADRRKTARASPAEKRKGAYVRHCIKKAAEPEECLPFGSVKLIIDKIKIQFYVLLWR